MASSPAYPPPSYRKSTLRSPVVPTVKMPEVKGKVAEVKLAILLELVEVLDVEVVATSVELAVRVILELTNSGLEGF